MTKTTDVVETVRARLNDGRQITAQDIRALIEVIDSLRSDVIAFGGPAMVEWARSHALPNGYLYPTHYDILAKAGARMDDFERAALEATIELKRSVLL